MRCEILERKSVVDLPIAEPVVVWRRPARIVAGTPLVVLLHGRGADENDLAGVAEALPPRFACASVRAPLAHAGGGYTWFESRAVAMPVAASLRASMAALRAWLDAAPGGFDGACYLLGFSAGMMMAAALLLEDPARFAGAVLLSGALPFDAIPASPGRLAGMPIFYGNGLFDDVIPALLVVRTVAYLRDDSGADSTVREYRHGHAISSRELDDIVRWFEKNT